MEKWILRLKREYPHWGAPKIRGRLRRRGYRTRDARVTGRGKAVDRDGRRVFDLLNGSTIELTDNPPAAGLPENQIVEVSGTSRAEAKAIERLTVDASSPPKRSLNGGAH